MTESTPNPLTADAGPSTEAPIDDPSTPDGTASIVNSEGSLDALDEGIFVAQNHRSAERNESQGMQNWILQFPESDLASFVETYHNGMRDKGWTRVASSELPIGVIANFTKQDRKCTISIAPPKDQSIKVAIMIPNG